VGRGSGGNDAEEQAADDQPTAVAVPSCPDRAERLPRPPGRRLHPGGSDDGDASSGPVTLKLQANAVKGTFVVPDPERLLVYRKDDGELVGTNPASG
jgi:hypothetical protein